MLQFCVLLMVVGAFAAPSPHKRIGPYVNQPLPTERNEDAGLTVIELIQKYGYPIEIHSVQTEDGYILEMHRIPYGKTNQGETNKPVIFLMHGLLMSSADWANMGPEKSLAYILADLGYDVWMGNARGNTWSRKHTTYDPDKDKSSFWTFSWNEIGYYDLPAMIDYALGETGQEKLFYIGHSQGTTSYFVMASERPEYNDKIRLMAALAPIAYMSNLENPLLKFLAAFDDVLEFLGDLIGIYEFLPSTSFLTGLGNIACSDGAIFQEVCSGVIFLIAGYDSEQLNRTMIPVIMTSTPAGSSTRQMLHYAQEINSGHFRKYDFGIIQNLIQYGSLTPPDYDISQITAPVSLFYSQNDLLAAVVDVQQFASEMPNVVYSHPVELEAFNHLDYMWAIDVPTLVYQYAIDLMQNY